MTRARTLIAAGVLAAALGFASPAAAVNGTTAKQVATTQQIKVCGTSFWWGCVKAWAPMASCYGRGGGTWECYGGVIERNRLTLKYRNCKFYAWINAQGGAWPRKSDCG